MCSQQSGKLCWSSAGFRGRDFAGSLTPVETDGTSDRDCRDNEVQNTRPVDLRFANEVAEFLELIGEFCLR
jgi:hypothetical protein